MRLCSLELQGFKSFPDKTYLEFDDGITAVVGPNGSGKSNIADAIRWVFGEQSTKTLRGGKMEDVIFSGTQARKAVGYASVKLTIDKLTDDFGQEDEKLTIARRLYRSGESEYRINGNIVRLKDVHELFMDTGLGRDGYSIIGQGRIAEIVSAKSAQRREIFEEAAGIAKFRYRRNEAEKRLVDAEENLLRLHDILGELEDRVGPLKIQSEKAKKYIILADERKELEISLWIENLANLQTQISTQQNNILISKNDYNLLETEGESLENRLLEIYQEMQQMTVEADELRGLIRNLEEELTENESKIAVYSNDIHHNRLTLERLVQQLDGAGKGEQELEALISEKQKNQEVLEEKLSQLKTNIETEKTALITQLEESQSLQQKLDGLNARKSALAQAIAEIQLKQAASESVIAESSDRLSDLREKDNEYDKVVEEYKANVLECHSQIEDQEKQIQSLENSKTGYTLKRDSKQQKNDELKNKHNTILKEIDQTNARRALLEDMEASMEGYAGSVKYVLNQSKKGALRGVFGAVSSLVSAQPKYIIAVETALGAATQNIVVEDENSAKQGITMLRDAKIGRATFLPLTSVRGNSADFSHLSKHDGFVGSANSLVEFDSKFSGIINQLLGRVCVVDDLNTGTIIAKQSGYKFRIVTLDGQVINAGGSYTGGAVSRSAGVLGRRNEIEKLIQRAKELSAKTQEMEPEIAKSSEELAGFEATLVGASAEIQSSQEELVRLSFAKEQLERSLTNAETNRDLAKQELEKLSERLKSLEEGKVNAQQLIDDNSIQIEQLNSSIEEAVDSKESLSKTSETNRETLSSYQMEELSLEKDLETSGEELARLKQQAASADEATQNISNEKIGLEAENENIEISIQAIKDRNNLLKEEIRSNNENITKAMSKRTELEKATTQLRQEEKSLSTKREEVSRELVRLEERQNTMQSQYDEIIAKMWDEYELTRSGAVEIAKPLENLQQANDQLNQIKNQIRGLGSVNLDAVEEYKEVGERYEFLSVQVADVENSRKKLGDLINDLTGEMRTIFEENFEKISEEFSRVFFELFGGGRGELKLAEGEDVLEAGVDINVQPPGKVIKNLSLLSGGEQAFVAIAIYFAILKVKPAPFVLLDEIEAALDDVNVVKYANYLRTLSDEIQFIAITHRRGTMEEADVLYGVTMQENGISKLLELKANEIESKLGMEA